MIKILNRIRQYLSQYQFETITVLWSLINVSICLLAIGKAFQYLVDQGLKEINITNTNHNILLISVLIILFSISSFFRSYFISNVAEKVVGSIRIEIYEKLLNQEVKEFETLKIGSLIANFGENLELIAKLITNFLSFFLRNLLMLLGAVFLMFNQSPKLFTVMIITISVFLIPLLTLSKFVKKLSTDSLQIKTDIYSDLVETFSHIRSIYAFNQQQNKLNQFIDNITSYLRSTNLRLKIRSLFFVIAIGGILLNIIFVIWVGALDILNGSITSGELIAFIYYSLIAALSAIGIAELFTEVPPTIMGVKKVFELIDSFSAKITYKDNSNELLAIENIQSIEFKNVSFTYPSRPNINILKNISFKIPSSKHIGIVGKSGSGKSTILQLLLGFYPLNSGSIIINNNNLHSIDIKTLRNKIGYVPQEPAIFSCSIKFNIWFANPKASIEEVLYVADIIGVSKFVENFDQKLDTIIGEKGVNLSMGQKQRIAIARAILIKPEVLLLDEATSALDIDSETKILREIKRIMPDKIIISVAHRNSAISTTDDVLVLKQGKIIE